MTKDGVYFTDSQRPVIYKVGLERDRRPRPGDDDSARRRLRPCRGPVQPERDRRHAGRQDADRRADHLAQAAHDRPETGAAATIDLGGYDLTNGDGLLLHGRTLYVVQNRDNKVAVFELSPDLSSATFVRAITDPGNLDVPTTIDRSGSRLYVVNARFGTTTPTDQAYHVVRLN